MKETETFLVWIAVLGVVGIVVGMCAQGRLKYWVLMALGAIPREKRPGFFSEIPRRDRDWALVSRLNGIDGPRFRLPQLLEPKVVDVKVVDVKVAGVKVVGVKVASAKVAGVKVVGAKVVGAKAIGAKASRAVVSGVKVLDPQQ